MDAFLKPQNAAQICDVVAWAVSEEKPLEVIGHGTKRGIGRAAQYGATLDLSGMTGITLYEPEELVLSARAGTPLAEIKSQLAEKNQELAFEPPDFSNLLNGASDAGTIGGAMACNFSGPRRIKAGAARDHFLGVSAVSGRGEIFKSGGRVVKNVTGYDLCKMLAGSWGTLAVMTDLTVKVLPAAETQSTLVVSGVAAQRAVEAMTAAMQSACEVSGACFLPAPVAVTSGVEAVAGAAQGICALRLEGIAPSVDYRANLLAEVLKGFGAIGRLDAEASKVLWREVRDVDCFAGDRETLVWRLSVAPADGAGTLERIVAETGATGYLDWAGGLIWLDLPASSDGAAPEIRAAVGAVGGHATLIRAPESVRSMIDVFQPQDAGLEHLSQRLKSGFDPGGILNSGRMRAVG